LAYHIIYSAYGFWLPNDPRGSWSTFVGSQRLFELFGPATKVSIPESVARTPHDWRQRLAAKRELKFSPAKFNGAQAREVAHAIRDVVNEHAIVVLACAVMPEHVHLVTAAHKLSPTKIVASCRAQASRALHDNGLWPASLPIWGRGKWAVALETMDKVIPRIGYVERNPSKAGLPPQKWKFVTPLLDFA